MGIKGLTAFLKRQAPKGVQIQRLEDFRGATFAIDVSNLMYQMVYNAANKRPANHLAGFFELAVELARYDITPVFILDGAPGTEKSDVLAKRRQIVRERTQRIEQLQQDVDDLRLAVQAPQAHADTERQFLQEVVSHLKQKEQEVAQLQRQTIKVTSTMWAETAAFLEAMGMPVLQATTEADLLSAHLARLGLVRGVMSEDTDHLTFGAPLLVRGVNNKQSPDLLVYDRAAILEELGLTAEQFVDLCILSGCDYTDHINGVGPVTAWRHLRQGGTVASLVADCEAGRRKSVVPANFPYEWAQRLFQAEDPLVATLLPADLRPLPFDEAALRHLLRERCHYRDTTLDPKLRALRVRSTSAAQERSSPETAPKIPRPVIVVQPKNISQL